MTNSRTPDLRKCIEETFDSPEDMDLGGLTFVNIAFENISVMRNYVISGLHKYLKNFARDVILMTHGDNATDITTQVVAVKERLCEAKYLPRENLYNVLTGLNKCSVPEFKSAFDLESKYDRLVHIELDSSQVDNRKTLAKVKNIYLMYNKEYNSLNVSGKWNNPGGHCHAHMVGY